MPIQKTININTHDYYEWLHTTYLRGADFFPEMMTDVTVITQDCNTMALAILAEYIITCKFYSSFFLLPPQQ